MNTLILIYWIGVVAVLLFLFIFCRDDIGDPLPGPLFWPLYAIGWPGFAIVAIVVAVVFAPQIWRSIRDRHRHRPG